MKIISMYLKEGLFERKIEFSSDVTLIFSKHNSCGKTTALRFLLYALGYNIPSTKHIKFNNCEVSLLLNNETIGDFQLDRNSEDSITLVKNGNQQTYVLPEQQNELHSQIFGTDNSDILANLLGTFYVDQEKGWTLLNRGVVIGSIHFNIEELIRGLSGRNCDELIHKLSRLQREKEKYNQMFSVAQYKESLESDAGIITAESYEEETDASLSQLLLRQRSLKSELRRIDRTLSDNSKFKHFVAEMKLLIRLDNGTDVAVTENNIVGLNDTVELLIAKRKCVSSELASVSLKIEQYEKEKASECEQLAFFETASQIEIFDKKILRLQLNTQTIKRELSRIDKDIKVTRDAISNQTKINNDVVKAISDAIIAYGSELGIGERDTIPTNYLFTSNLKELSGALLHKTAFAFRLAYISVIESTLNIKLPIILDSPSGKEVDESNIALMMEILKRDYSDHQIIIASIRGYDFPSMKVEEIHERLINSETDVKD